MEEMWTYLSVLSSGLAAIRVQDLGSLLEQALLEAAWLEVMQASAVAPCTWPVQQAPSLHAANGN